MRSCRVGRSGMCEVCRKGAAGFAAACGHYTCPVTASSSSSVPAGLPVDAVIDRLGLGAFQWRLLAICGLTWAADAMEVLLMSFALPG